MANATLIHSVRLDSPHSSAGHRQHPPIHFAKIRRDLMRAGHRVTVIDAFGEGLTAKKTLQRALATHPDIIGINGYMTPHNTCLTFVQEVLDGARDQNPEIITVVGGAFTARKAALDITVQTLNPHFAVVGEGELPIKALISSSFTRNGLEEDPRVSVSNLDGTTVLRATKQLDLDTIELERPTEWLDYTLTDLDWQRGCAGSGNFAQRSLRERKPRGCTFCAGFPMAPTFKSADVAAEEMLLLTSLGKRNFFTIGPDFAAGSRASEIIDTLNFHGIDGVTFLTEVRLGHFIRRLEEAREAWVHFGTKEGNSLEPVIGYESGHPGKLLTIGKVARQKDADNYLPSLLDLLDQNLPFTFSLAWMLIDPSSTLPVVLFDILVMRAMLEKYQDRLRMNPPSVANNMGLVPGMPLYDEVSPDWPDTLEAPVGQLYRHMYKIQNPGRTTRAIRGLVGRATRLLLPTPANSRPNTLAEKSARLQSLLLLKSFVLILSGSLSPRERKHAREQVSQIADSFGDSRIRSLVDSQIRMVG